MHPELANLQSAYNRLIDDFEAGHISYEQATSTLAQMTAVDGGGWVWSIDPSNGTFVRSQPGGPAQVAQPGLFVPASTQVAPELSARPGAGPASTVTVRPPGLDDLMRPPTGNYSSARLGSPVAQVPTPPVGPGALDGPAIPLPVDVSSDVDVASRSRSTARRERAPRAPKAPRTPRQSRPLAPSWLRGRTVVLIALCVVVLVVLFSSGTKKPSGGGLPTPTKTNATTTTLYSANPGSAPTSTQMDAVLAVIGGGDVAKISKIVEVAGSPQQLVGGVALYAGLAKLGYAASNTPAVSTSNGAVSTLTFTSKVVGVTFSATAHWVNNHGTWELANWPVLH